MILVFAKKYNQLIIYAFFVTRKRNKEKKKVIRPGLEPRTFRFQLQERYLLSYTATRPDYFTFLTLLFNSSSLGYIGSFD